MPKLRIFMAEDSAATCARLKQDLSGCGDIDIVGCAETEIAAVTWLARHPQGWDLTIVDLTTNADSGLRTLAACRVRGPCQKVILVHNDAVSDSIWRRCRGLGADLTLDKLADSASLVHYCAGLAAGAPPPAARDFMARLGPWLRRGLTALVRSRGLTSTV